MGVKLSVIVPLYDTELKLIKRCLKSINKQYFKDYELICILNGHNNDRTKKFINKLRLNNLKLLISNPCTVSEARNIGLRNAEGEYISFVDADDMVNKEIYIKTIPIMEKNELDYLRFAHKTVYKWKVLNTCVDSLEKNVVFNNEYIINKIVKNILGFDSIKENIFINVWGGVLKKSFLVDNNLFFNANRRSGEDWEWLLRVFKVCNRLMYIDDILYNYNRNVKFSLSSSYEPDHFINAVNDRYYCMDLYPMFNWNEEKRISVHINKWLESSKYYSNYLNKEEYIEKLNLMYDTYKKYKIYELTTFDEKQEKLKSCFLKSKDDFISFLLTYKKEN